MKKHPLVSSKSLFTLSVVAVALIVSFWIGCGEQFQAPSGPAETQEIVLSPSDPQVRAVMELQEVHTEAIMAKPGVVGIATGMTEDGKPAILVFVKNDVLAKTAALPNAIAEVPVIVQVTGEFKALKGRPGGGNGGGFDPKAKHRPAPNGVSLGHPDITAGTLGCLVTKNNTTYILSNNHVMANENLTKLNDPIYQPGPFDGGTAADKIAELSEFVAIDFSGGDNVVDAAIAAVNDPSNTDPDVTGETEPDSYGPPRSKTIIAAVNMRVMKYGRTTEETKGRVQAINATVNVGYDTGVARFVGQIVIGGGGFSAGGDSGSLIVVQKGSDARSPVGLLYAGGAGVTIANPIADVLSAFNVTVVGN